MCKNCGLTDAFNIFVTQRYVLRKQAFVLSAFQYHSDLCMESGHDGPSDTDFRIICRLLNLSKRLVYSLYFRVYVTVNGAYSALVTVCTQYQFQRHWFVASNYVHVVCFHKVPAC